MSDADPTLWSSRDRLLAGRRRVAPRVQRDGDVTRMVGVGIGAAIAAVTAVLVVALGNEPAALRSPGPLALPHREAALACGACHGAPEQPMVAACVGCHGPHPSARRGHRGVVERGALPCQRCHRIHVDEGGVELDGDRVRRYGPGDERELVLSPTPPRLPPTRVPVIAVGVCDGCHDLDAPRDPIARCLLGGQAQLGAARPTACFDEHRSLEGITFGALGSARERLTAWELARRALVQEPVAPRRDTALAPWWWAAGLAFAAGLLTWALLRTLALRRLRAVARARVEVAPPERVRLPLVDASTCIGCSACVDACPYDVLELRDYVAQVVRAPDCCGLTLCEQRCPNGSLVVTDREAAADRIALDADLQSRDVPGLYLAGDLTGLPLIRNAINQGAHAMRACAAALARGGARDPSRLDVVVIGAGPAGLAAALEAMRHGLSLQVFEQGSVAESVRSFPRGKLVFDQPLSIPLIGDLWLKESSKEELLGHWLRIVRARAVPVAEHHRVTAVTPLQGGGFAVQTLHDGVAATVHTRRVVVAIGKRGTPRRLPVELPDAVLDRVHYGLADARSFIDQRVVVAGLGDVAMEAAIALAHQRGTTVTIVHRGEGMTRGKARNIAELQRLVASGRIALRLGQQITAVTPEAIGLAGAGAGTWLPWDRLLVLIGSLPPWDTLAAMGVRRVDPEAGPATGADPTPAPPLAHRTVVAAGPAPASGHRTMVFSGALRAEIRQDRSSDPGVPTPGSRTQESPP
ncbi:MAG: NAD(P)-binding domain-containing protein [Deltaproteobacteria bacterium]|nr:NAD(P)-binding domain-containing protein [Deltaproteobacteria bacterium]